MEFASKNFAADGRAALAIVYALLETLEVRGVIGKERKSIVERAEKLIPDSRGGLDVEAKELLRKLAEAIG